MLDSLVDPKFRARALRNAGRKAMQPVKESLQAKLPEGGKEEDSYKHYGKDGYKPGDLKAGVIMRATVNSDKAIKTTRSGGIKDKQKSELTIEVTFKSPLYRLAMIMENGRKRSTAKTRDGKVFYAWGRPTDKTERDIGTFKGFHFVSQTFAEEESAIVDRFRKNLIKSIQVQAKKYSKRKPT
ncbi:hypothetical protein KW508_03625 [Vibrio fluvialis]|nr:hypothetical protein [Vibrio fluvialis]